MNHPQNESLPRRLVVGISGASGVIYGVRLLEILRESDIETHLVMSSAAELTLGLETELTPADVKLLADTHYAIKNIGAAISSGSFQTMGMVIMPCSIKSMSEIAHGITSNLLSRAADVMLKERRPLVLCVRETPFHLGHLRTMTSLAEMGAVIAPPLPAFYPHPNNIQDLIDHSVGRILDLLGIENSYVHRWREAMSDTAST